MMAKDEEPKPFDPKRPNKPGDGREADERKRRQGR